MTHPIHEPPSTEYVARKEVNVTTVTETEQTTEQLTNRVAVLTSLLEAAHGALVPFSQIEKPFKPTIADIFVAAEVSQDIRYQLYGNSKPQS